MSWDYRVYCWFTPKKATGTEWPFAAVYNLGYVLLFDFQCVELSSSLEYDTKLKISINFSYAFPMQCKSQFNIIPYY